MWQVMKWSGKPNVADYFPFLKPVDPLGIFKQAEIYFGKVSVMLEEIVNERLRSRNESGKKKKKKNDMVEALIDINQRDEGELSLKDINHLLIVSLLLYHTIYVLLLFDQISRYDIRSNKGNTCHM